MGAENKILKAGLLASPAFLMGMFKWPLSVPVMWIYGGLLITACGFLSSTSIFKNLFRSIFPGGNFYFSGLDGTLDQIFIFFCAGVLLEILSKMCKIVFNIWLATVCWVVAFCGACLQFLPSNFSNIAHGNNNNIKTYPSLEFLDYLSGGLSQIALATFIALVIEALVKRWPLRDKPANLTLDAFE